MPPAPRPAPAWASTLVRAGDNAFTQRRTDEAIAFFERARNAARGALELPLPPASPARQAALDQQSQANQRLAGLSMRQTGAAYDRGLALAQDQLQAAQALAAEVPGVKSQEALRVAHDFLAVRLLNEGQVEPAVPHIEQAVALARAQQASRPARDAGVTLATSLVRHAEILAHRRQGAQAVPLLQEGVEVVRSLHLAEPEDRHLRARYVNVAWRVGEIHNLIGDRAAVRANLALLPAASAAAAVFKPQDGVFYLQSQRVQQELAHTALRDGDAAGALRGLAAFPTTLPPEPAAAADLAEVFLLRAQALHALGQPDAAWAAFDAGHAALQAAAARTPGHVQLACKLAQARRWAEQASAGAAPEVAARYAALAAKVAPVRDALLQAGKLTPWWALTLAPARLPPVAAATPP